MPRKRQTDHPAYRLHKATGQAVATLNGRDHYLGKHGTDASRERYDRLIAEWLRRDRRPIPRPKDLAERLTVTEMVADYWTFAKQEYRRPDGSSVRELENIKRVLRPLVKLYGSLAAEDFGPPHLKTVREEFLRNGWVRKSINLCTGRVKRAFKWAVAEGLVPGNVHHALSAVAGLRWGRSAAPESTPVQPVLREDLDAILPFVSRQVAAMAELQWLSGMRPGEVVQMRKRDLDTSGETWIYTPESHKTQLYGKSRRVDIGPCGQDLISTFLKLDPDAYLFSPKDAMEEYRVKKRKQRKTPMTPSQRARRRKLHPEKEAGERYDVPSYRRAIHAACKRAGIDPWSPNQLRHAAATRIRRDYGLDAARAVLGHSSPEVTAVYAEVDAEKCRQIMKEIG